MASEAYRGLFRILGNYGRLGASLILGLIYVPIFLLWLGEAAFGLLTFMGASVGIAAMATEVSKKAMLRELAAAHHGTDETWFASVYNSSFIVSLAAAALTLIGFGILLLVLPLFRMIPDELMVAARWLVAGHGTSIVVGILLQPAKNMYLVHERFLLDNIWTVAHRAAYLGTGLVLIYAFHITEPATALIAFSITLAAVLVFLLLAQCAVILYLDRRLLPRPRSISRRAIRDVAGNFGVQAMVTLAMNIHERMAMLIVMVLFGPVGNTIYGVSLRLSAYSRMVTYGVTGGLETVTARIDADEERSGGVRDLLRHTTRLHTFVALPAGLAILFLAEPILWQWIGSSLTDPATSIPMAATVTQILMFALVARSIGDGWIALLYGSGHLKRYAPLIIAGGLANPVLTLLLIAALPEHLKFNGPALAFAMILSASYLCTIPVIVARCFDLKYIEVVRPMARPAVLAFGLSPILIYGAGHAQQSIVWLFGTLASYALAYAAGGWTFALSGRERHRFSQAAARRLPLAMFRSNAVDAP